jgi:serine/threonine protein kinase/Tol biopolymer transport system component
LEERIEPFQLGKYRVIARVGKGGFGEVYRAEDTSLGREVAVKVLHPYLNAPDFIERFKGEARLAAGLQHPGIVTVYDMGESDGRTYLVMAYLPGGSLQERIAHGPLSFDQAARILTEICAGLEELHARGLVHRDLKPGNILFNADGQAVLTDFELARSVAVTSASSTQAGAGTPFYKAPEVWRGKPPAGPQADVYALGCILYEMLTGKILFDGDTPDEIITKHLVDGPDLSALPTEGVPQGVKELLVKTLSRDPAQRFTSAGAFAAQLASLETQVKITERTQTEEKAYLKPDAGLRDKIDAIPLQLQDTISDNPLTKSEIDLKRPVISTNQKNSRNSHPNQERITQKPKPRHSIVYKLGLGAGLIILTIIMLFAILVVGSLIVDKVQRSNAIPHILVNTTNLDSTPINPENANRVQMIAYYLGKADIISIDYSPDGSLLVLGTSKGIYLFHADSLQLVTTFDQNKNINEVVFSPDGKTLASCANDDSIRLWDISNGYLIETLEGHNNVVKSIAFSPNGKILASGSIDNTIKLWNLKNGKLIETLNGHTNFVESVAFSPDGKTLASGSDDNTIIIWDVASGEMLKTLQGHTKMVDSVAFSPDGKTLASASWDQTVKLWDVSSGQLLRPLEGYTGYVYHVAFSPNGKILATGESDPSYKLWDVADGKLLFTLKDPGTGGKGIVFSPDGSVLATGVYDGYIRLWGIPKN